MYHPYIINRFIVILVLFIYLSGCASSFVITDHQLDSLSSEEAMRVNYHIESVLLKDRSRVVFVANTGQIDKNNRVIRGVATTGEKVEYAFDDIRMISYKKYDAGRTVVVVLGIALAVGLIVYAMSDIEYIDGPIFESNK